MNRFQILFLRLFHVIIFIFMFSGISAQELIYLNKYKVPIKDVNAYEPVYFKLTTDESGKSVAKTYCMDSSLIHEKHTIKTGKNTELVLYDADYYGNGSLRNLEESVDNKKVSIQEYYENAKLKSKKLILGEEVLEEAYFDEEGNNRSKIEVEHPEPFGGIGAWNQFLARNLKYPKEARKKREEGTAYLYFKLDEEGIMQDIAITNPESISPLLAEEAIRVLTIYPYAWVPCKVDGKPVNVEMRLPLRFKL